MKKLFFLSLLLLSGAVHSQSLADAGRLFDTYEYQKAAQAYEGYSEKKSLGLEDYKRLAYCYYITGDLDKCAPYADSLVKIKGMDPFFYFAHGMTSMYKGNYDSAKKSFQTYQTLDNEFPVGILMESCDSLMHWQPVQLKAFSNASLNHSKANISGSTFNKGYFYFKEIGLDSLSVELTEEAIDKAEALLSKPFFVSKEGVSVRLTLPEDHKFSSVTSAVLLGSSNDLLMTIYHPLSNDMVLQAPHLYIGKLDAETNSVSEIQPWQYSGFEDSTSSAYATVNGSGTSIIFSKIGRNTKGSDLYCSTYANGSWSTPIPLNVLNTAHDELFPMYSGDSLLSFASNGRPGYGALDIYCVHVKAGEFGPVTHLKAPINGFSDDFAYVYLADSLALCSSNRKGGLGDDDIYYVAYEIDRGPSAEELLAKELADFIKSWIDLKVYFDYSKYDIKSLEDLDRIAAAVNKFEQCSIVIEGHTDERGKDEYNKHLGYFRADAIRKELIAHGLAESKIKVISKGKSEPQVDCSRDCTEAQHALNRVAIVKLVVTPAISNQ